MASRKSYPIKLPNGAVGHATFAGKPTKEQLAACEEMAAMAFTKLKALPKKQNDKSSKSD